MNHKLKLAGGLAVVLFGLGALATWDEWQTKRDKELEANKNKLTSLKQEDVVEVSYFSAADAAQAADAEPKAEPVQTVDISLSKTNGSWNLVRPLNVGADAGTVDNLIKTIVDYAYGKIVTEDKARWAEFGLAEPKRWIKLITGGQSPKELTVFVGAKVPVGYEVYLRTSESDRVYTGSQHLLLSTTKSMLEFRDKSIVKIDETKVSALSYQQRGEAAIDLSRLNQKFVITQPKQLEGDSSAIKEFIDELSNMRATGFIDKPDEALDREFANPNIIVTVTSDGSNPVVLKFVEHDEKVMAMTGYGHTIFLLGEEWRSKLKKQLMDFRSRRILEADMVTARSIDIDGQLFKNVEGNWYSSADALNFDDKGKLKAGLKEMPRELAHIRAFVVDLEFAKTDKFIESTDPEAKSLPSAPLHRIVLGYNDPNRSVVSIDAFKIEGDAANYLIRRTGSPFIYRVPVSVFASMTAPVVKEPEAKIPSDTPMDDDDGADLGGAGIDSNAPNNSGTSVNELGKPG